MVKVCPDTPCKTCPVFCQPLKQIWCEDDFKVCKPSKEICKGGFFSESVIPFSNIKIFKKNIPKSYPELEI